MQVKPCFSFERYVSNGRPMGAGCWPSSPSKRKEAAMKRCALCHGKLGLDARFRNRWNGRWWVHVRFCSVRCEAIYEVKQNDAAKHRWHAFLAHGNSRTNCLALGRVPINAPIAAPLEFLSQKALRLVAAMSIVAFVRSVAKLALNLNTSVSDYGPAPAAPSVSWFEV